MTRDQIISQLSSDVKLGDNEVVKTVVIQSTLWADYLECRCFTSANFLYSALIRHYEGSCDSFVTRFELVPNKEGK